MAEYEKWKEKVGACFHMLRPQPGHAGVRCEALGLLPRHWPNHDEVQDNMTYSKLYRVNNVVTTKKKKEKDRTVDLTELRDALWSNTGDISKILEFNKLPKTLQKIIKSYEDVFSDSIGDRPMDCTPVKLNVDETVPKPPKVTTVRVVPLHWQSSGERILTDLLQTGIVKRVTKPVPCVSPSFFVKKGDGSGDPRFVIDYKGTLNPMLIRVPHPLPSPMQVWARVKPGSTHFIACDLKAAFWQLPLSEESQGLTSFMSSLGVLAWTRLPMGVSVAPDTFNREVDIAFSRNPRLTNMVREVDDCLLFASSQEELEEQFCELLKTCREARITLAPKKTYYAPLGESLRYAGMKISSEGAQMSDERAEKLATYPEPTNRKELAAWIGLSAQCNSWFPEINQASHNMRQLLRKDREFVCTETFSDEFKAMRKVLCSKITLSSFNKDFETKLLVDSIIKFGVAYVLLQISPEGKITVVRCGSCSVPRSWHSLSAVEVEAAGIARATNHARFYLCGAPLVKVLTGSLENLSPKLF